MTTTYVPSMACDADVGDAAEGAPPNIAHMPGSRFNQAPYPAAAFAAYPTKDAVAQWLARYQYLAHTHVVDALSRGYLEKLFLPSVPHCGCSDGVACTAPCATPSDVHDDDVAAMVGPYASEQRSSFKECQLLCNALLAHVLHATARTTPTTHSTWTQNADGSGVNSASAAEATTMGVGAGCVEGATGSLDVARCLSAFVQTALQCCRQPAPLARTADVGSQSNQQQPLDAAASPAGVCGMQDETSPCGRTLDAFLAACRLFGLCHAFPFRATTQSTLGEKPSPTKPVDSKTNGSVAAGSGDNQPQHHHNRVMGPSPRPGGRVLNNAGLRGGPGIGLKKQYELDLMAPAFYQQILEAVEAVNRGNAAAAIPTHSDPYEPSDVVVVDIGAGQGYLSAQLAVDYGLTVVAVERAEVQLHGSLKRSEIAELMQEREMALKAAASTSHSGEGQRRSASGRLLVVGLDVGSSTTVSTLWDTVLGALAEDDCVSGGGGRRAAAPGGGVQSQSNAFGRGDGPTAEIARGQDNNRGQSACSGEGVSTTVRTDVIDASTHNVATGRRRRTPLVVLVSLHACGPLSNNMLRLYADWQLPSSFPLQTTAPAPLCILCVNVGCCYNYLLPGEPDGFPISRLVRDEMVGLPSCIEGRAERHMKRAATATDAPRGASIGPSSLQLTRTMTMSAVQAPFRWFSTDSDGDGRSERAAVLSPAAGATRTTTAGAAASCSCKDGGCDGGATLEDVPETFSMLYLRALLQRVLQEACGVDDLAVIGRVPAPKKRKRDLLANESEEDVFVRYAAGVVDRVRQRCDCQLEGAQSVPEAIASTTEAREGGRYYTPTSDQLRAFYRQSRQRLEKEQLSVVWTLKVLIGHGLEALILADRCQYLVERLTTTAPLLSVEAPRRHHVELLTLFDPRESPRNQAVVARWQ